LIVPVVQVVVGVECKEISSARGDKEEAMVLARRMGALHAGDAVQRDAQACLGCDLTTDAVLVDSETPCLEDHPFDCPASPGGKNAGFLYSYWPFPDCDRVECVEGHPVVVDWGQPIRATDFRAIIYLAVNSFG
jgi:hypothetical protein